MQLLSVQLEEAVVYRLYRGNDLLYVGCTGGLRKRLSGHHCSSPWWPEVDRVEFDGPLSKSIAARLERVQIHRLAPLYNRVWNWRRGWDYARGGQGLTYFPQKDQFRSLECAA